MKSSWLIGLALLLTTGAGVIAKTPSGGSTPSPPSPDEPIRMINPPTGGQQLLWNWSAGGTGSQIPNTYIDTSWNGRIAVWMYNKMVYDCHLEGATIFVDGVAISGTWTGFPQNIEVTK